MKDQKENQINQPVSEDWHSQEEPNVKEISLTANPGDRIADEPQTIEEKSQQVAVDSPDITGDHVKVPTYFIVEEPDGEKKHSTMLKMQKKFLMSFDIKPKFLRGKVNE